MIKHLCQLHAQSMCKSTSCCPSFGSSATITFFRWYLDGNYPPSQCFTFVHVRGRALSGTFRLSVPHIVHYTTLTLHHNCYSTYNKIIQYELVISFYNCAPNSIHQNKNKCYVYINNSITITYKYNMKLTKNSL